MNTTVTFSGILKLTPLVLQGYGIVIGAGGLLVIGALIEKHFARNAQIVIAERISAIIKASLPFGVIATLIYFVLNNPLL
ncbi:hypothetical protein MM326_13515 [Alkalihalobacillus sp. LMS6]|uniref:hypothetical protein n=1 Tax=Alkalihalobacillus sp. LMS6 TaxID=2924034 RepID=UPI0020D111D6|nr:hypothetical protein [Alkalihalobacillus sp. LMS6]UTR05128.1 hypothetical protein MM326_13515 [Alkalihalobacillus sp. LMS6]